MKQANLDTRKVLVVDDQPDVREALCLLLKGAGYSADTAESPNAALAAAAYDDHDLIVVDMNYTCDTTSGDEGLGLVGGLRAQRPNVPIIAMTAWSTVELAVEAMHRGACDFIPKPWDNRHFLSVIEKHLRTEPGFDKPLDAELSIARKVQRKLLPPPRFSACGVECECASVPAGEISGDLYDFFRIGEDTTGFVLGDVSGKGIGAALLVANLQATIRSLGELALYPAKLIERVNGLFSDSTRPEHYATLFYAAYDSCTHELRYVNCGHPAPVVVRGDGSIESLEATSTVLGMFKKLECEERIVPLIPGDRVIVFSDGFSEAKMDEEPDDWALTTIRRLARYHKNGFAGVLAGKATSDKNKQADDITVMDVRIL
ncbi:MAG TPA: SpoIIE family protein phosphatase [Bryobacteraceae bacterium]|nr:SpoIIE family protein phosphatase [Bryobacteraceae bacterium]